MIDKTTMTVPQKTAFSIPAMANAIPASPPCRRPISSVPLSVARVTEVNFCSITRSSALFSGR